MLLLSLLNINTIKNDLSLCIVINTIIVTFLIEKLLIMFKRFWDFNLNYLII